MANPNPSPATRFRPGGPPGPGRPRSKPLTDRLRERLEQIATGGDGDGRALADELVDRWVELIRSGDGAALRELLNRVEGKVTDRVEHEGEVTIRVEFADADEPDALDHAAEAAPEAG